MVNASSINAKTKKQYLYSQSYRNQQRPQLIAVYGNQRCSYEDGSVIMQLPMQIGGRWTCTYDHAPQTKHSKSIETIIKYSPSYYIAVHVLTAEPLIFYSSPQNITVSHLLETFDCSKMRLFFCKHRYQRIMIIYFTR